MAPFFEHYDEIPLTEAEVPVATGKQGTGQRIRVGVVERDNGLTTATTSTISNALYDLADQNSTTHTVLLPHGTTVKLGASVTPQVGSWRAKFVITNPKLNKTVEQKGASAAADMANQIDLLALGQMDKDALAKVTEAYNAGSYVGVLLAIEGVAEGHIDVSGYVTKSGRHVGAYSQIRKSINSLKKGDSLHFPDGIEVRRVSTGEHQPAGAGGRFAVIHETGEDGMAAVKNAGTLDSAARHVAEQSAMSTHPNSLGGAKSTKGVTSADAVDQLDADNPKLPGTPHPEAVAARAAAGRKSAQLPSRKERSRNEAVAGTTSKVRGLKDGESVEVGTSRVRRNDITPPKNAQGQPGKGKGGTTFEVTGPGGRRGTGIWTDPKKAAEEAHSRHEGNSNSRSPKPGATDARHLSDDEYIANFKVMHGRAPNKRELATLRKSGDRREREAKARKGRGVNRATADRGGSKNTTPSGLPLPPAAGPSKTSGGPGQRDDPSFSNHRSKQSDASFGDVSKKTVEGWSDRILGREIDANPGRTTADRAKLKVMQDEYRRRKTAGAQRRGFIGG